MTRLTTVLIALAVGTTISIAEAKNDNKGKGGNAPGAPVNVEIDQSQGGKANKGGKGNKGDGDDGSAQGGLDLDVGISDGDIAIIKDYVLNNKGSLPSGMAGAKPLPPGIAKNLGRGKPLPPGIAKTRFPDGLSGQLTQYPNYEWLVVGQDVVLVDQTTQLIVDLVKGMF